MEFADEFSVVNEDVADGTAAFMILRMCITL